MVHEHNGKGKGTWSFDINGNMRVLCEFDEDMYPMAKKFIRKQSVLLRMPILLAFIISHRPDEII
jgi:hypothetical protein